MDQSEFDYSESEALAFMQRFGLTTLSRDDARTMAEAMTRAARAGLAVTRVGSKFDAPAPIFALPTERARAN